MLYFTLSSSLNPHLGIFFYRFMMDVRKNVLEYIITLVVVKNKVRLKRCLNKFQIWQSSIPQINLFILQSVHLLYKYTTRINFGFIRSLRINFWSLRINFYTYNKLLSPAHRFRNYFFVFLLSCEGVKILTVTNVNNRRRFFSNKCFRSHYL